MRDGQAGAGLPTTCLETRHLSSEQSIPVKTDRIVVYDIARAPLAPAPGVLTQATDELYGMLPRHEGLP